MADNEKDQEQVRFIPVAPAGQNIGIETKKSIVNKLKDDEGMSSRLDAGTLSPFRDISSRRELQYQMYDDMAKDVIISSALDLYADDATEYDEEGRIIWATSDDADVAKSVNYLIESLKLNENAWLHVRSLVQYGDIYLQTFRASDVDEQVGTDKLQQNTLGKKALKESKDAKSKKKEKDPYLLEDVIVNYYSPNDRLEEYIELVANPAEVFDLVKRGKTNGFLKTVVNAENKSNQGLSAYSYKLQSNDIKIYDATKYVHISLPDPSNRSPEKVQLFREDATLSKTKDKDKYIDTLNYDVKRGKSILYDVYKIYRELKLLEDSVLLSRLTKSSILRVVQVEVGDMGKSAVQQVLQRVKTLMEQKTSMTEGSDMSSYLNPGAIENNIYIPTRNNQGTITTDTIGGDFDPGQLTDLDYFNNKLFGGLKIPKPFLGFMDDNAGFSGGESLTRASSRYAKTIKRIKNAYIQGITTLINIFLIDRGAIASVNNFTIKMVSPTTTEDTERMEILQSKTQLINDIMSMLSDIEDSVDRLKIVKSLINKYIGDEEIIQLLEDIIKKQEDPNNNGDGGDDNPKGDNLANDAANDLGIDGGGSSPDFDDIENQSNEETPPEEEEDEMLPNPADLDLDLADNDEVDNQLGGEE